ncbi:hypothetical protein [Kitasatospora sp. NPDC088548]|uniref:hypothetical protein n=1 Tax=Kitasatospora sp. NPDC088548 TaxID=3364075 RepID=UPI00381DE7BD
MPSLPTVAARAAAVRRLRDDPAASEGERASAQTQLDRMEARHGPLDAPAAARLLPTDRRTYGSSALATLDLSSREIAALIKDEIRAARAPLPRARQQDGTVAARHPIRDAPKGTRITVRHRQFTGNSAIDIAVRGVPLDWAVDGLEEIGPGRTRRRLSEPCAALVDAVAAIAGAYNWRGDDTLMQDYVDVRFYSHVNLYTACGEHLVT